MAHILKYSGFCFPVGTQELPALDKKTAEEVLPKKPFLRVRTTTEFARASSADPANLFCIGLYANNLWNWRSRKEWVLPLRGHLPLWPARFQLSKLRIVRIKNLELVGAQSPIYVIPKLDLSTVRNLSTKVSTPSISYAMRSKCWMSDGMSFSDRVINTTLLPIVWAMPIS